MRQDSLGVAQTISTICINGHWKIHMLHDICCFNADFVLMFRPELLISMKYNPTKYKNVSAGTSTFNIFKEQILFYWKMFLTIFARECGSRLKVPLPTSHPNCVICWILFPERWIGRGGAFPGLYAPQI
jgi:hypothetical protein